MTVLNNLGRYHLTNGVVDRVLILHKLYVREYGGNMPEMKNRAGSY